MDVRKGTKSTFLSALQAHPSFLPAFVDSCPLLVTPRESGNDVCIIIVFLYYAHAPTPEIVSFYDFSSLWTKIVQKYAFYYKCTRVYLVIDKPEYLPPPRRLLHQSRSQESGVSLLTPKVLDSAPIPHGKNYTALLSSSTFKANLIHFYTEHFITRSIHATKTCPFELDSPSLPLPVLVSNGVATNQPPNKHGEAMWHHAIHTPFNHIVIVSSDTDTWVYGLGLAEVGWLRGKHVYVKRGNVDSYVDINLCTQLIAAHPSFRNINYPVSSLVALYVLTGSDYVSHFY